MPFKIWLKRSCSQATVAQSTFKARRSFTTLAVARLLEIICSNRRSLAKISFGLIRDPSSLFIKGDLGGWTVRVSVASNRRVRTAAKRASGQFARLKKPQRREEKTWKTFFWLTTNEIRTQRLLTKRTLSMTKRYCCSFEDRLLAAFWCFNWSHVMLIRAYRSWVEHSSGGRGHFDHLASQLYLAAPWQSLYDNVWECRYHRCDEMEENADTIRCGGVERGNRCWMVGGKLEFCVPRYIGIGWGAGYAR